MTLFPRIKAALCRIFCAFSLLLTLPGTQAVNAGGPVRDLYGYKHRQIFTMAFFSGEAGMNILFPPSVPGRICRKDETILFLARLEQMRKDSNNSYQERMRYLFQGVSCRIFSIGYIRAHKNMITILAADGFGQDRIEAILGRALKMKTADALQIDPVFAEELRADPRFIEDDQFNRETSPRHPRRWASNGLEIATFWIEYKGFRMIPSSSSVPRIQCNQRSDNAMCFPSNS